MINIISYAKKKKSDSTRAVTGSSGFSNAKLNIGLDKHYLWGQAFDGRNDVNGDLKEVGDIDSKGNIKSGSLSTKNITADESNIRIAKGEELEYKDIKGTKINVDTGNIQSINSQSIDAEYINSRDLVSVIAELEDITASSIATQGINANDAQIGQQRSQNIVVDNLTVNKVAHFFNLSIDEVQASKGQVIVTPANAKIEKVEILGNGNFKCWWRATDGERNIKQTFAVDDLVVCQTLNKASGTAYDMSNKFYWRKVEEINAGGIAVLMDAQKNIYGHYIVLSDSDKDPNSNSNPDVNDEIAQLGNKTDEDRQSAIIISAYNSNFLDKDVKAPSIVQYSGINDYNIESHRINTISAGGNHFKGNFVVESGKSVTEYLDKVDTNRDNLETLIVESEIQQQSIASLTVKADRIEQKVTNGDILLDADKVKVANNGQITALFENGKIKADHIEAERLFTGEIDAHNAVIKNITITGFMRQKAFHVTEDNFQSVTIPKQYKGKTSYEIDFEKTGTFIVFDYLPTNNTCILFPSITYNYGKHLTRSNLDKIIPFLEQIGQKAFIINNAINNSTYNSLHIAGCFNGYGMSIDTEHPSSYDNKDNEFAYYQDKYLLVGSIIGLECNWKATGTGSNGPDDLCVYWDFKLCLL